MIIMPFALQCGLKWNDILITIKHYPKVVLFYARNYMYVERMNSFTTAVTYKVFS